MRHIIAGGQHCGQHNMELCGLSVSGAASGDILKQLPAGGWTTLRELELGKLSARELGFEPITRVIKASIAPNLQVRPPLI